MRSNDLSRRGLITAAGAFAAGAGLTTLGASSAQAVTPTSFNLTSSSLPLLSGVGLQFPTTIMQSFAFDYVAQKIFVVQITGTDSVASYTEHARQGDLTINELNWQGVWQSQMRVQGCGHGFAIGAVNNNDRDKTTEIFLEFNANVPVTGQAYGTMITHVPYKPGYSYTKAELAARSLTRFPGHHRCGVQAAVWAWVWARS